MIGHLTGFFVVVAAVAVLHKPKLCHRRLLVYLQQTTCSVRNADI